MVNPGDFFTAEHLKEFFNSHLRYKKGGGIDGLSPNKFLQLYESKFDIISNKCLNGTYKFSCYREKLVIKGAKQNPRVLSIPSMRDRLVLGILNEYLQKVYSEKGYQQNLPNMEIKILKEFLSTYPSKKRIRFLKTDFHNYYGTINRRVLLNKLGNDVDKQMLSLIRAAIESPTIPKGENSKNANFKRFGIPQGLSISNILAYVYLKDFDDNIGKEFADVYIRYVDDILFINPKQLKILDVMRKYFKGNKMHLSFTKEKISKGYIEDGSLNFIGYNISQNRKISIRQSNVTNFITKLAGIAKSCKDECENVDLRPEFRKDDEHFNKYYTSLFNLKIGGFVFSNHKYGWMNYYQGIDDIHQLYSIDKVVKKRILAKIPDKIRNNVYSLVNVYYDIKDNGGKRYLTDFGKYDTIEKQKEHLSYMGYDLDGKTEYEITDIFHRYISNLIRQSELSLGRIS